MKKFFQKFRSVMFVFALFISASVFAMTAQAVDEIDVEYPVGTNVGGNDIFNENNVYPGWSESKTIQVKNQSATNDTNLYFNFDVNGDKKLAEKLNLYVVRVADNSYRIGGVGDRWGLREADEKNLYTDKLAAGESEQYKIKVRFDKDAGNEYQGLEADFDIDFIIESEDAGGAMEEDILMSQGRVVTGEAPIEEVLGETISENGSGVEEDGIVAGKLINNCRSWPFWAWALALVAYLSVLNYRNLRNLREQRSRRWLVQLLLSIGVFILWYKFDACRIYAWFPIVSLVGGVICYLYYLYKFGRVSRIIG